MAREARNIHAHFAVLSYVQFGAGIDEIDDGFVIDLQIGNDDLAVRVLRYLLDAIVKLHDGAKNDARVGL